MCKQMTFTRSETQRLIALLHSRTIEESPSSLLRLEASTRSGSLKKHKHGDERDNFHAAVTGSRDLEEQIASPVKAYKGSTIGTDQAPKQDSELLNNNATCFPKRSMALPATMENLPEELLSNIFIRLLARQLAQMRSVSKSWNALLSQSSFVKSHLNHSIHSNYRILIVFCPDYSFGSDRFTSPPCGSYLELTQFLKFPIIPRHGDTSNGVIGSVNGLICFSHCNSVIQIWNPSLSAVLFLPPFSMPSFGSSSIKIYFRFGFDPKTDDYKIVKLTGFTGSPRGDIDWWLQVEIYSLRQGSWKLINEMFPSRITKIHDHDDVCADGHDGHLHWLGHISKMDLETIVTFDLASETFHEIPLPDSVAYDRSNFLGTLTGKLCVMSRLKGGAYEVWVMDEYGVVESWVKRHVFSLFFNHTIPFGFTSNNEFLIDANGYLLFYDTIANKAKLLENYYPERFRPYKIVEYVESLVWVAPTCQT